jgi:hypothetical protein
VSYDLYGEALTEEEKVQKERRKTNRQVFVAAH